MRVYQTWIAKHLIRIHSCDATHLPEASNFYWQTAWGINVNDFSLAILIDMGLVNLSCIGKHHHLNSQPQPTILTIPAHQRITAPTFPRHTCHHQHQKRHPATPSERPSPQTTAATTTQKTTANNDYHRLVPQSIQILKYRRPWASAKDKTATQGLESASPSLPGQAIGAREDSEKRSACVLDC